MGCLCPQQYHRSSTTIPEEESEYISPQLTTDFPAVIAEEESVVQKSSPYSRLSSYSKLQLNPEAMVFGMPSIPVKDESPFQLLNVFQSGFLHSHCLRSQFFNSKRNEVKVIQVGLPNEYCEWYMKKDTFSVIQNGDVVQMVHALTGQRLCALSSFISKKYELVCTQNPRLEPNEQWRVELDPEFETLKIGYFLRLVHIQTQLYLSVAKIKKTDGRARLTPTLTNGSEQNALWRIVSLDMKLSNSRLSNG